MGVKNWLDIRNILKGRSGIASQETEVISSGVNSSENTNDDATNEFLQELQDIASQLKERH